MSEYRRCEECDEWYILDANNLSFKCPECEDEMGKKGILKIGLVLIGFALLALYFVLYNLFA